MGMEEDRSPLFSEGVGQTAGRPHYAPVSELLFRSLINAYVQGRGEWRKKFTIVNCKKKTVGHCYWFNKRKNMLYPKVRKLFLIDYKSRVKVKSTYC